MERIEADGEILAIVLRKDLKVENVSFFSPEKFTLQLGVHVKGKGAVIKPHLHLTRRRVIEMTQEMLHISKGVVEVEIFDARGNKVGTRLLHEGDTILFAGGGHGLKVLDDCRIVEVKQGPYDGKASDKKML